MSLETYGQSEEIYLARGQDVSHFRPTFTGDVFQGISMRGVESNVDGIVIAHPCSFRRARGQLADEVLVARVIPHSPIAAPKWATAHYSKMPLPDLTPNAFHIAEFNLTDRVEVSELTDSRRTACLSEFGINLLQQRLTWHLTRCEVPTTRFHDAFGHTYEEADLLEEWCETLADVQIAIPDAHGRFEEFIRSETPDGRTYQDQLKEGQRRSGVRTACRAEAQQQARRTADEARLISRAAASNGDDESGEDALSDGNQAS